MKTEDPVLSEPALPKGGLINLRDHGYINNLNNIMMDIGVPPKNPNPNFQNFQKTATIQLMDHGGKLEYRTSFPSQGNVKGVSRYFTLESMFLLICLTASLLILPLVLPPLPPPPLMLLLLPIGIMGLLMFLAFTPANARDGATITYA